MVKSPGSARSACGSSKETAKGSAAAMVKLGRKGRIAVGTTKAADVVAADTLDTIQNDALNEVISELLAHPEKILVTARIVKNDNYFKKRGVLDRDWLHKTIVKLSAVPKGVLLDALLEYRRQSGSGTLWTEELLKKTDKVYKLHGIGHLFQALSGLQLGDSVPPKCHFRPFLRAVLIKHMQDHAGSSDIDINPQSGEVQFDVFNLCTVVDSAFTEIRYNKTSDKIPVPDEYRIKADGSVKIIHNWGLDARVKGKSIDRLVVELFEEAGRGALFARDPKTVLDKTVAVLFDEHKASFFESLKKVPRHDRPQGFDEEGGDDSSSTEVGEGDDV